MAALLHDLQKIAIVLLQLNGYGSCAPWLHVPCAFATSSEAHPRMHPRCARVTGARETVGRACVGRWPGVEQGSSCVRAGRV